MITDDEEDDDYLESFFDGILGDDDGKSGWSLIVEKLIKSFALSIDDDDDDEDDSSSQTVSQPAQQAVQQIASSPISSDEPAGVADEVVADNIDDVANTNIDGQADIVDSDAKDPQQAAQDQAATINNNIDPVGNEAIVDDEDGKFWKSSFYVDSTIIVEKFSPTDDDEEDFEDALEDDGKFVI